MHSSSQFSENMGKSSHPTCVSIEAARLMSLGTIFRRISS